MADEASVMEQVQHDIELPNGVVVSGVGGDVEALRDSFEARHEERTTGESAEPVAAPEAVAPSNGDERPMSRATKRVQEAVNRAKAAEEAQARTAAELQQLREQFEALTRQAAPAQPAQMPPVPATPQVGAPRPTPDQFDTYDQYYEALGEWKADQVFQRRSMDLLQQAEARAQASIEGDRAARQIAAHTQNIFERGQEAYSDFDAVIGSANQPLPPLQIKAMLESPNPEHVMYLLAKNPDQFAQFARLQNDLQIGMFLGQLSAQGAVSAASTPRRQTTSAPAPPQPLGSSTPSSGPSLEELASSGNYEAYKAKRRAQLAR